MGPDYARIYDLNTLVFRHSSMYGNRQFSTYDQGWISWFCQKALETKNNPLRELFTISGTGKQVRDVLHVSDVVDCYFLAVENIKKIKGQVFNIGGGIENSLSLLELFNLLENELDVKLEFKKIPWRESDQKVFISNIEKARKLFDWKPKVYKEKGINMLLGWSRNKV